MEFLPRLTYVFTMTMSQAFYFPKLGPGVITEI